MNVLIYFVPYTRHIHGLLRQMWYTSHLTRSQSTRKETGKKYEGNQLTVYCSSNMQNVSSNCQSQV